MARNRGEILHGCSPFLFVCIAGLFSNSLVFPVTCRSFEGQKSYYAPPDPPATPTPTPVYVSPPHIRSPPSGHGGSPPHHHPTPSPPANCDTPPSVPTPSTPSGGYYSSPPPTPVYVNPPSTPTPTVPITPITPTPSTPSGGYYSSPPPTPVYVNPPSTPTPTVPITPITPTPLVPITPTTPTIPSPPFTYDPNNPFGGTCNFWRNNPTFVWGLVGWFGTVGNNLGVPSTPGFPSNVNLLQALSNTRNDGYGALYREGTASFLNSMVNHRFPFTTAQVRNNFVAALGSSKAAGAQAQVFRKANEGHLKPRA